MRLAPSSEIRARNGSKKELKNSFYATESVLTRLQIILKNKYMFLNKIRPIVIYLIFASVFIFPKTGKLNFEVTLVLEWCASFTGENLL